jgi:TPR repeat protein
MDTKKRKSKEQGRPKKPKDPVDQFWEGFSFYFDDGNYGDALISWKASARRGNTASMWLLACCYLQNTGLRGEELGDQERLNKGLCLLRRAAKLGNELAKKVLFSLDEKITFELKSAENHRQNVRAKPCPKVLQH